MRKRGPKPLEKRILPIPSTPEELLKLCGEAGLTNEEIAPFFGMNEGTFRNYLFDNPDFAILLDQAKEVPNHKVEASLFRRALGYQVKEITKVDDKPVKVVIKEVAPDVIADIFWLKNRDPRRWRDSIEVNHTLRDRVERAHQVLSSKGGAYLPDGDKLEEVKES